MYVEDKKKKHNIILYMLYYVAGKILVSEEYLFSILIFHGILYKMREIAERCPAKEEQILW